MPDKYKKIQPGDQIDTLSAEFYNSLIDVVLWFKTSRGTGDVSRGTLSGDGPHQIVWIKNTSGSARSPGDILGYDDDALFDLSDADARNEATTTPILKGVEPEFPTHIGKFVVLLDAIDTNDIGQAILGGLCVVKLDVVNSGHKYADVSDGVYTKLKTRAFGGAEIIKKESTGTGDKYALVRLGQLHLPDLHGVLTEDLNAGSDADVTVWEMADTGSYASVSRTENVWGNMIESGKLANGSFVWFRPIRESGLLEVIQSKPCAS